MCIAMRWVVFCLSLYISALEVAADLAGSGNDTWSSEQWQVARLGEIRRIIVSLPQWFVSRNKGSDLVFVFLISDMSLSIFNIPERKEILSHHHPALVLKREEPTNLCSFFNLGLQLGFKQTNTSPPLDSYLFLFTKTAHHVLLFSDYLSAIMKCQLSISSA